VTLVVPTQGERILLKAALGQTPATGWTLRLFINNVVPSLADTEADYVEAAGGGYAPIAIDASQWAFDGTAPTRASYPTQRFTFSGPLMPYPTVYGYYLTQADGALVYAERLADPFTPGDWIDVTPEFTLGPDPAAA
jgi:hypothetical protein